MTEGVIKRYEFSRTRDVILDIIKSNITDPLSGDEERTSKDYWIFDNFPNPALMGVSPPKGWRFPIVVISYPESESKSISVNGNTHRFVHTIMVECHSEDRANNSISGREEVIELAEEIQNILLTSQTDLKTGSVNGPYTIRSPQAETDFIGARKYCTKTLELDFERCS